jgi:hypothetical protein
VTRHTAERNIGLGKHVPSRAWNRTTRSSVAVLLLSIAKIEPDQLDHTSSARERLMGWYWRLRPGAGPCVVPTGIFI